MAIKVRTAARQSATTGGGASAEWEDAPTEFTRRNAIIRVYGDTGTGRTRLALTMPGPIGLAHTAEKIDGVVQQFSKSKKIRIVNFGGVFNGTPQEIADQANPMWDRMIAAWYDAVNNWARTVIMDTDYEGWEILRLARFGELTPQGRLDALYGKVNAEWRSVVKCVRAQDRCSAVLIGQTKDEYRDKPGRDGKKVSEATGRTIKAGQKEMNTLSDVVIRMSRTADGGFKATIEKGWWNAGTEGMEFENDDCRLPYILSLITETDEGEWS